jgi:hypothetical protein
VVDPRPTVAGVGVDRMILLVAEVVEVVVLQCMWCEWGAGSETSTGV